MSDNKRIDTTTLGLLLKEIGLFDNDDFIGRLRMQKNIYILKSFNVELGYNFYWYIHGVYSKELAEDGHEVASFIHDLPVISNNDWNSKIKPQIEDYMTFIKPKQESPDDLEIISSILYLDKLGFLKDKVLEIVENKKERFVKRQCEAHMEDLIRRKLVSYPRSTQ